MAYKLRFKTWDGDESKEYDVLVDTQKAENIKKQMIMGLDNFSCSNFWYLLSDTEIYDDIESSSLIWDSIEVLDENGEDLHKLSDMIKKWRISFNQLIGKIGRDEAILICDSIIDKALKDIDEEDERENDFYNFKGLRKAFYLLTTSQIEELVKQLDEKYYRGE